MVKNTSFFILATEILSQIKNFNKIERLVYMSSDLEVDLKNFINFGQSISETLDNEPFVPEKAVVVDILPHTKEYELIISFKRFVGNTEICSFSSKFGELP